MTRRSVGLAVLVAVTVTACASGREDGSFDPGAGGGGGSGGASSSGGAPCASGGPAGVPVRLATATNPSGIAIDGGSVFWIDSTLGTVNEVSICGGAPTTLATTSTLGSKTLIPAGIAVASGEVYFTTQDPWNPNEDDGAVWKVSAAGGASTKLVGGLDHPGPIAVSGASLYWIDAWQTYSDDGRILRAALDGSARAVLASAQNGPLGLALGGGAVVWTTSGYVDSEGGSIVETPMGAGSPVDGIAVAQSTPVGVAVEGADVFWANEGDPNVSNSGSIMKTPLDPNAANDPITLVSGGAPRGIAVDAAHVYWTDSQSVFEAPLGGGPQATVATDQVGALVIAVDDANVYWTTLAIGTGEGSVMKLAK
jgi:hypothetical protein